MCGPFSALALTSVTAAAANSTNTTASGADQQSAADQQQSAAEQQQPPEPPEQPPTDAAPSIERIEKETAAANEPPNLHYYLSQTSRGPSSDPARWYMRMTGESWDGASLSYEKAKKRWRGLMGDNERRVEQRSHSDRMCEKIVRHM